MSHFDHSRSLIRHLNLQGLPYRIFWRLGVVVIPLLLATVLLSFNAHPQRRMDPQCVFNDECNAPLVCSGQMCREQCRTSRDCQNGWVCLNGSPRGSVPNSSMNVCADPAMLPALPAAQATDNLDFPGEDFVSFPVGLNSARTCLAACQENRDCQAYTYVKAGIQSATAVCYLKKHAAAPVINSCCISGRLR